jgi:hypothetical protein
MPTNILVLRQSFPGPEPVRSYLRADADAEAEACGPVGLTWAMTIPEALQLAWDLRSVAGGVPPRGARPPIPESGARRPWVVVRSPQGGVWARRYYEDGHSFTFRPTGPEALEYASAIESAASAAQAEIDAAPAAA